jgi:hypothetical protein
MAHFMSSLRSVVLGAMALLILVTACGGEADEEGPWGSEATSFFEALTVEHSVNDFYGVLDFYTPSAFIEKWRGDLRGGAPVAELLRWNSGDLDQEVLEVHLNSQGAITVVSWASTDEWSAVASTLEGGLINGETVFDFSGTLEQSLRASPDVIATYESLYTSYAAAWSSGDSEGIERLYAPSAALNDDLTGLNVEGSGPIAALGSMGVAAVTAPDIGISDERNAVFLGPVEYGEDPGRAVGVFDVTDASACVHRVAVLWHLEAGLITSEDRYHDVGTFPGCFTTGPDGWWTGLALPAPSDEVVTGMLRTPAGHEVNVHNGTPLLEQVLHDALSRYSEARLDEPTFDAVIFEPSRQCVGRSGRLIQSDGVRNLFLCLFESDLCLGTGQCEEPTLSVRGAVLHELAHAWTIDHVSADREGRFLDLVGLDVWQQADLPWSEQGVEYSAEVIAWGLLDRQSRMARIGSPDCVDLAAAFRLLTGTEPLQVCEG